MQFVQLEALEKEERDHLLLLVEDSKLPRRFGEELSIYDGEKAMEEDKTDFQKPKSLLSVVQTSTWFDRVKRTWYTPECLFNLKELLHLLPSDHKMIRHILNIPKFSDNEARNRTGECEGKVSTMVYEVPSWTLKAGGNIYFKNCRTANRTDDTW